MEEKFRKVMRTVPQPGMFDVIDEIVSWKPMCTIFDLVKYPKIIVH